MVVHKTILLKILGILGLKSCHIFPMENSEEEVSCFHNTKLGYTLHYPFIRKWRSTSLKIQLFGFFNCCCRVSQDHNGPSKIDLCSTFSEFNKQNKEKVLAITSFKEVGGEGVSFSTSPEPIATSEAKLAQILKVIMQIQ